MRSFHPAPTPGFQFTRRRGPQSHHLAKSPDPGQCDEHGCLLQEVSFNDLPGAFDARFKEGVEFRACPECYPGQGEHEEFDGEQLARDIVNNWEEEGYSKYFRQDDPPDLDSSPKFEFI